MSTRIIRAGERIIESYPLLFLFFVFLAWCAFYLLYPTEYSRDVLAPRGVTDQVFFGGSTVVSQGFVPHAGISGITIPVGSDTYPDSPLLLHVRETIDGEDMMVVSNFSFQDEYAIFRFPPIWFVPEKAVWILEAPHAPKHSFWVYREKDASIFTEGKAFQNTKAVRGNLGFTEIWESPRFTAFGGSASAPLIQVEDFEYHSFLFGFLALIAYWVLRRYQWSEKTIVIVCIGTGFLLHLWLGMVTPLIIDEGAYIQDALQSSSHLLPFRDFLTKGPLYIFALWLWSFIVPHTVIAWRLFSAIAWVAAGWFFWKLTLEWELNKRSRLIATTAFSLMPAAIALTTPLLLQTASCAVAILGLVVALRSIKNNSVRHAMYAGILFTTAFFVRVTAVVPAFIAFLTYLMLAQRAWKFKLVSTYVGTGILLCAIVFGGAVLTIGVQKTAVLMNMEAILISQNRQGMNSENAETADSPLRATTIESRLFMRAGVLFLSSLVLFPLIFVNRKSLVLSAGILVALFFLAWKSMLTLIDTNFLMPKTLHTSIFLVIALLFGFPFITALSALLYNNSQTWKGYWKRWQMPVLILLWLFLTMFAYAKWGRFRQSYLTEFLPQLALLLGISLVYMIDTWKHIRPFWLYRVLATTLIFFTGVSFYQGLVIAERYPHSGTIDQKSLTSVVRLLQENVPAGDMVFTAQPVATAFADRQIMFGYSHPGWYREAYFGTIPESLRDLLFRRPEVITEYLRNEAKFVLTESRTDEIYFEDYPERQEILRTSFVEVDSANDMAGDTVTLYKRR